MMPKLTPRLNKVIETAAFLHREQKRKNGETPYIAHLIAVAWIIAEYTDDEDVVIAGLMHDTLEDVEGYMRDDLVRDCGERVAAIVEGVTNTYHPVPPEEEHRLWEILRSKTIERLREAPQESLIVKVADTTHNLRTMVEEFKQQGEDHLKHFKEPLGEKLKRAEEVVVLAKERSGNPIVTELESALEEARAAFAPFIQKV